MTIICLIIVAVLIYANTIMEKNIISINEPGIIKEQYIPKGDRYTKITEAIRRTNNIDENRSRIIEKE